MRRRSCTRASTTTSRCPARSSPISTCPNPISTSRSDPPATRTDGAGDGAFEPVVRDIRPDWVLVVGDVNSTMACALVTAQLRPALGCRLAHVEAGLRSRDWDMPEEIEPRRHRPRLRTCCSRRRGTRIRTCAQEGLDARAVFVGNVMIDTLLPATAAREVGRHARPARPRARRYVLVTLHRPSNVDDPDALRVILDALAQLGRERPVVCRSIRAR